MWGYRLEIMVALPSFTIGLNRLRSCKGTGLVEILDLVCFSMAFCTWGCDIGMEPKQLAMMA